MSFNVMIVDDSNAMRSVIKKIISISGFKIDRCIEAVNGKEALEALAKNWVDVIISDINMPEMNGFELLERLKEDDLFRHIPVIVVSTEGSEQHVHKAFDLGVRGYIKKPFLPEEVRAILYEVIGVSDEGEYEEDTGDNESFDF